MNKTTDVIIIGTGVAGLFCALNLPETCSILMITKDAVENSDSYLAQGGISTLKSPEDYNSYFEDTMKAGRYQNKKESVEIMIRNSPEIIQDLMQFGVDFDKNKEGLSYTREGAHSTFRILHHKDITGKEITSKLLYQVKKRTNIKILEYTTLLDLMTSNQICTGIVAGSSDGTIFCCKAKSVVFATGGIGGLFENSTNFSHLTADGVAIAIKHGIAVENINYIQIHPTTLYSKKPGRRFLISESLRGEGAILLNKAKKRFVNELLPRDLVSMAIQDQMIKYHCDYVYLSLTHMPKEEIKTRFPNIYQKCLEEGYRIEKDLIPVTPAQHYFMGGIQVGNNSQTSMKYLYAIGETSCNGVHGANRLASNSLLESLVFAKRAASQIQKELNNISLSIDKIPDLTEYQNIDRIQAEYKNLVLNEIKRKDEIFYDKWCNHAGKS